MENNMELEKIEDNFQKFVQYFHEMKDTQDVSKYAKCRVSASVLKEQLEKVIKELDEYIEDNTDVETTWKLEEFGKSLELIFKKNSTIDNKIIDELTDEECRKGFTVTAKVIESLGRKDLLEKYKSITESKALKLYSLKG